jgi:carbon-monoxide dehydrogenase small subunit
MILVARDLLKRNPHPTETEIRHHIKGNICRCTGYNGIVRAIQKTAAGLPTGSIEHPAERGETGAS